MVACWPGNRYLNKKTALCAVHQQAHGRLSNLQLSPLERLRCRKLQKRLLNFAKHDRTSARNP
eukprot:3263239-Alexandrium_andersonii.AAC.1